MDKHDLVFDTSHATARETRVPFSSLLTPFAYLGEAFVTATTTTFEWSASAHARSRRKAAVKATALALRRLDKHTLDDIGVTWTDIAFVTERAAEDPSFDTRSFTRLSPGDACTATGVGQPTAATGQVLADSA